MQIKKENTDIYFDNAATTKPSQSVFKKATAILTELYGNPSSLHKLGIEIEREIIKSTETISNLLDIRQDELIFTSGGTESNNIAIQGTVFAHKRSGNHIITTKAEHSSVLQPFKFLEENGFSTTYLNVNEKGYLNIKNVIDSINDKTVLVSISHVNSETGTVQNISEIGAEIKRKNKNTIFHVDGVQSFGKLSVNFKNIDLFSFSSHKIHGIKGTGGLYVKKGLKIKPLFYGGGQQLGLRSGTENTIGIVTFGVAALQAYENMEQNFSNALAIKNKLLDFASNNNNIFVNGDALSASPYILNLSLGLLKGEVVVRMLDSLGIYASTGAACNLRKSRKNQGSVLQAYGISNDRQQSAVRFSFSSQNSLNEAEIVCCALKNIIGG